MDNRLARIGETLVQYKERREGEMKLAYERKVVKRILLGLGVSKAELGVERPDSKDDDGSFLTFAWLYDRYPSFPILLMHRETWAPSIVDFFKVRSRNNTFWQVWEEITESFKHSHRSFGCIFPFPQVTDLGHGIVHSHLLPNTGYEPDDVVFLQRRYNDGTIVTLEQLDSFINRLRVDWEPV